MSVTPHVMMTEYTHPITCAHYTNLVGDTLGGGPNIHLLAQNQIIIIPNKERRF